MSNKPMKEVEIAVIVQRVTEKAILVDHGGDKEVWIPISQITDYSGKELKTADSIFISEWLAIEKGLI